MNKNRSSAPLKHTRDIINILLTSFSRSVLQVTDPRFFPLRFMARALRAWAINRGGKKSVRNLRYGPRTRLVRGIYHIKFVETSHYLKRRGRKAFVELLFLRS